MHENQNGTGKFARFFEEKGFYIILFLCVMAIGIAGYVLFLDPSLEETDEVLQIEQDAAASETEKPVHKEEALEAAGGVVPIWDGDAEEADPLPEREETAADLPEEAADPDEVIREAVETIASSRKEETPPAEKPKEEPKKTDTMPTFFVRPVSGEVLRKFSGDELVYDRTMGDWRTHNGVDFSATDGALVYAVADGVVEDVYQDAYYGTGVLVNHGGGLMSVYLGLIENATVTVGQAVTAGDTIGAVATSTLFEALEPAHLHMEMTLNGKRVDPMDYLPA